jgi:hypothetical protein
MDTLNRHYLNDERNWFFQETFVNERLRENSVWPAKIARQDQASIYLHGIFLRFHRILDNKSNKY